MLAGVGRQRGRRDLGKEEADREGREQRDDECRDGGRGISRISAHAGGQLVQDESPEATAARRRFAVDQGVGPGDEIVQAFGRGVEREVATRDGEVAARAAVEPAKLEHVIRGEPLHAPVRLGDQVSQARPARAPVPDESDDPHHGRNVTLRSPRSCAPAVCCCGSSLGLLTVAAGRLEVETPDHVVLRYDLAGAGNRGFAAVIDFLIATVIAFTADVILAWAGAFNPANLFLFGGLTLIVTLGLIWAYFILLEWLWNGQTIGKRVFKLRVINEDGPPAQFTAVLIRNLLRLVDFLPAFYGVGVLVIVLSPKSQRLGDLAAGADRVPPPPPPGASVSFSPGPPPRPRPPARNRRGAPGAQAGLLRGASPGGPYRRDRRADVSSVRRIRAGACRPLPRLRSGALTLRRPPPTGGGVDSICTTGPREEPGERAARTRRSTCEHRRPRQSDQTNGGRGHLLHRRSQTDVRRRAGLEAFRGRALARPS